MISFADNASWIWCNNHPQADEYGEFVDKFSYNGGKAVLQISADSNYAVYLNGELVAFGQYADFPHDKVYDEIDVTKHCRTGENRLGVVVWYYGCDNLAGYFWGNAALAYAVYEDERLCCQSDEKTGSRMSRAYQNHRCHKITNSIGYTYHYDATKEDEWLTADVDGFVPATIVKQTLPLRMRSCKRLELRPLAVGKPYKQLPNGDVIYALDAEEAGFLHLRFNSPCEQTVTVFYGEHLEDGCVRRLIDDRDFSVSYRAVRGENVYLNPFRRLGCVYLQVHAEQPLDAVQVAICPTVYPLEEAPRPAGLTPFQNKLYDMCVRTLVLCAHEHYEDCPWREQGFFALDARNQMLAGYYAFDEYEFPRANLELVSKDRRDDGLLTDCYPMSMDFAIPSFSLHFITACREYLEHSGDGEFIRSIYPKIESVVRAFTDRIGEDELVHSLVDHEKKAPAFVGGSCYWNFYEWRDGLDGLGEEGQNGLPDLLLNSLLSRACQHMTVIAERLGEDGAIYRERSLALNRAIRHSFRDEDGTYYDFLSRKTKSELGNSLAVLCGAATAEDMAAIEQFLLTDGDKIAITLSMIGFKYDALLAINAAHKTFVLQDIERIYTPMMDYGSTTVWEVEEGACAFDNAGSLCHGWSAMPIYYYHKFCK